VPQASKPKLDPDQVKLRAGVQNPAGKAAPLRARHERRKETDMAESTRTADLEDEVPDEPVPVMQQLLDNPFLLLFLGIAMPTVLYIVWGVMEIVGVPVGK
jgi:hypothetical protein